MQGFDERREVVGISVHFISIPGLARSAMAAAVMRDTAETFVGQKNHLVFPGICAERPAMAENDGLSLAPVLVVDLRAVFGRDLRFEDYLVLIRHFVSFPAANVLGTTSYNHTIVFANGSQPGRH